MDSGPESSSTAESHGSGDARQGSPSPAAGADAASEAADLATLSATPVKILSYAAEEGTEVESVTDGVAATPREEATDDALPADLVASLIEAAGTAAAAAESAVGVDLAHLDGKTAAALDDEAGNQPQLNDLQNSTALESDPPGVASYVSAEGVPSA